MGLTTWGLSPARPGRLRVGSALALYRRRLRRGRWIQDLLAVLGIAAGVALLYATQVAATSLSGPVGRLNDGIVGAGQLQVLGRGGGTIDERTYDRIVTIPGVRRAAPLLQIPGSLSGTRGEQPITFFGADPRIVQLRGSLLRGFTSTEAAEQETVVVPEPTAARIGLKFGDDVQLQLDGRRFRVPAAVAGRKQIGGLVDTSIALVPLPYLQRLAGTGARVSRVLVEAEPGHVGAVRDALRRLRVRAADVRSSRSETELFNKAAMPTSAASTIFAVLSALVGWMFAVCALLVTASDRRRLVAQQRRQGFPPSATLKILLIDAAVIGAAGVLLGLAAGEMISRHGFDSDVSFLSGAFPIGDVRVVTWQSIVIAGLGGFLAATIGILAPVRELVAESLPRWAMRATGPVRRPYEPRRIRPELVFGTAALSAAMVITLFAPDLAVVGLALLGVAVACLLPLIVDAAIGAVARLNHWRVSSAAVELALHQLRARRWRARGLAIATIGAVAVFGATSLQGARLNLQHGLDDLSEGLNAAAAVWITAPGAGSSIGTSTFAPRETAALAAIPGVARVDLYRAALLDIADRRAWVLAPPQADGNVLSGRQIIQGTPGQANHRLRTGGWASISRALADDLGVHVGDPVTLPTPAPITVRVAAITTNLGWSSGAIALGPQDFHRAWGSDAVAAYQLQLVQTTDPAAVVKAARQDVGSGLVVETAAQRATRQSAVAQSGLSRLRQITALTILAAVLAMAAAMTGLLWQHRRSVAAHKFLGLSTSLLWRSLLAETSVLFGVGVLTGALFGLLGQILCTRGVERVTGFPVILELQPLTAAWTAAIVLAASSLAVLIPGYLVARAMPSARE